MATAKKNLSVPRTVYTLTEENVDSLKDQVLLVLADYKSMSPTVFNTEGTRIEIANRIVCNVRVIGKKKVNRRSKAIYGFNGLAGCVAQRRSRQTGTLVGLYHSLQSGMESDPELPWTTVCEDHSNLVSHSTLRDAKTFLSYSILWCDDCREKEKAKEEGTLGENDHQEALISLAIAEDEQLRKEHACL